MNEQIQNPITRWPFGTADVIPLSASGDQAVDIYNDFTFIDGVTVQSTAARTLNLSISPNVGVGARIIVKTKSTGAETFTPGTGMIGAAIAGVAGKTKVVEYVYDGTNFINTAAAVQID